MKRLVLILLLFLFGCVTTQPCPSENLYYIGTFIDGEQKIIAVDKGFFDNRDSWKSEEEFREFVLEMLKFEAQRINGK